MDKGVGQVTGWLNDELREAIPRGTTVLVAFVAPIRLARKTVAFLTPLIGALLMRKATRRDERHTVLANRVRVRVVRHGATRAPRLVAFAHSANRDADALLTASETALGLR
jgi:hypothetical protein